MGFVLILRLMQLRRILFLIFLFITARTTSFGQTPVNFHHLTVKNGLNDGGVNAMARDKYGYMWFASLGGLNRFNGTTVQRFTHIQGDTASPPTALPYAMSCGEDGRLWIGYNNGLVEFEYEKTAFKKVPLFKEDYISGMISLPGNKLYIIGSGGFRLYNTKENRLEEITAPGDSAGKLLLSKMPVHDFCYKDNCFYLAGDGGYIVYDLLSKKIIFQPVVELKGAAVNKIIVDNNHHVWMSNFRFFRLLKFDPALQKTTILDSLLTGSSGNTLAQVTGFEVDNKNRVWMATSVAGLVEYDGNTGKARTHQYNKRLPGSISSNQLRGIFISKDNSVWVSGIAGIDFFQPDKNLFSVIFPFADTDASMLARGVAEDAAGNLWFTTGTGISRYNPSSGSYKTWYNQPGNRDVLYHNSVRSIIEDENRDIWIATGQGINRYNAATGKIDFLTGEDSVPRAFYYSINKDSKGTLWFGTKDYDGLYYYIPSEKRFHSIAAHPVLKRFTGYGARYVMEDSKKRLWIGFNGAGLGMYNPADNSTRYWINDEKEKNTIAGNLVVDIKEDKNGIIWVSTFNGITGINTAKNELITFNDKNGLKSNLTCGLAVDAKNRLWISSSSGLMLLDSNRKNFTYFNEENGLPSSEFPEHPAIYTFNGDIIMPSIRGYIRFNPLNYSDEKYNLSFFIASVKVFNQSYQGISQFQETRNLSFSSGENFFTIELEALNFNTPGQTWYAYQLDGFEKDWHYTQDPKAVYTNVPGGNYTFRYKATANVNDWNVKEKTTAIHIGTVFYKIIWVQLLIGLLLLAAMFWVYKKRILQQQQVHSLQSKAQALEKEKALVMYENLKQQLNPHFLFNSLTSLNSLIQGADKKTAAAFLSNLSKTYRYILKSRDVETVALADEIKFAESYVNLQKTRFEKGFDVEVHVAEEFYHRKIVPVTLQNLIENAIKHNIIDEETPLVVTIEIQDDYITVSNNLQKKKFVETSNKQGLANLQSLYGYLSNHPVIIEETSQLFCIKIPLL